MGFVADQPHHTHCKNREDIKRWADRLRQREREENLPRGRSAGRAGAATVQREGGQEDNGKRPLSDNESDVPSLAARASQALSLSPPIGQSVHPKWYCIFTQRRAKATQLLDVACAMKFPSSSFASIPLSLIW